MRSFLLILWAFSSHFLNARIREYLSLDSNDSSIISKKRIELRNYKGAYNPSICKFRNKYILTFRYHPQPEKNWCSLIGVLFLDKDFNPISKPQLLKTRGPYDKTVSQSEDARIFKHGDQLYLIYNDNLEFTRPKPKRERRDLFITKLNYRKESQKFYISSPKKLIHQEKYPTILWQKNWIPFSKEGKLFFIYTLFPNEIITPDDKGLCSLAYQSPYKFPWKWGRIRGSSPAEIVDGEYFGFFHSSNLFYSEVSNEEAHRHYFIGAYTFSPDPPFQITRCSPSPIISKDFYKETPYDKRVVYPGGYVVENDKIHMVYGRNDEEIWMVTFDKQKLLDSLVKINVSS